MVRSFSTSLPTTPKTVFTTVTVGRLTPATERIPGTRREGVVDTGTGPGFLLCGVTEVERPLSHLLVIKNPLSPRCLQILTVEPTPSRICPRRQEYYVTSIVLTLVVTEGVVVTPTYFRDSR